MRYENVELQGIDEITPDEIGGVRLQRVPEALRPHLNEGAQQRVLAPACAEIRFVSDGASAKVTLSGVDGEVKVTPFFGGFVNGGPFTVGPEPTTIEIAMPERFADALPALEKMDMPFAPRVCRLMMRGAQVRFDGVEGEGVRAPRTGEVPSLRYLSYGTSITHGGNASAPNLTYVAQTARRLGADLINLGLGGACQCEHEMADYIAGRDDWHIATLALSVNMMGFTPEDFRERVTYMVNTVAGANHARPVACITLYSYFGDKAFQPQDQHAKSDEFRQILRDVVADCPHPNVHVLEGREMLADYAGLTTDLIHPADDGMIQMGENIARHLLPLVGRIVG